MPKEIESFRLVGSSELAEWGVVQVFYKPHIEVTFYDGTTQIVEVQNVGLSGLRGIVCLSNQKDLVLFPSDEGVEAFII